MNTALQEYQKNGSPVITEEFVEALKQWVQYDDMIKETNTKLKAYRKKKNDLGKSIQTYMKKNHIEKNDINITGGGKVRYKTTMRLVPVNKEYVFRRLMEYFNGNKEKATQLADFIYNDREKIPSATLSRTRSKKTTT
jgi:hypothetical protein